MNTDKNRLANAAELDPMATRLTVPGPWCTQFCGAEVLALSHARSGQLGLAVTPEPVFELIMLLSIHLWDSECPSAKESTLALPW